MCKEAAAGFPCACGQVIAFPTQHWPHCTANPKNMDKSVLRNLSNHFTPNELAIIAHAPTVETLQASVAAHDKTSKRGRRR